MSLVLNLETAAQTKRSSVIQAVKQFLSEDLNRQVFYIVPDNQQLTMEFEVLNQLESLQMNNISGNTMGIMRLQVFSFKRMAWYLGIKNKETISKIGLTMVIKKVLEELEGGLTAFQKERQYLSFQEQLYELFAEFDRGNMTEEYLKYLLVQLKADDETIENSTFKRNEYRKLEEILDIYKEYNAYLKNQKLQDVNIYEDLVKVIEQTDLSHTMIVIDGFDYFKASEYSVVKALIEQTHTVILSLLAESKDINQEDYDPTLSVFTGAHYIYHQLSQLLPYQATIESFRGDTEESSYAKGIQTLEQWWREQNFSHNHLTAEQKNSVKTAVDVWQSESVRVEADQAASAIYHEVSEGERGYRYKDFQIFVGDFDHYQSLLVESLKQNGIPYYIDRPESMAKHPLTRFLSSLYNVYKYNWRYEDVFSMLKTELFKVPLAYRDNEQGSNTQNSKEEAVPSFRRILDRVENIVLAKDYQGRLWWSEKEHWYFDGYEEAIKFTEDSTIIQFRNGVYQPIQALFDGWKDKPTVREAVSDFYDFMTKDNRPMICMQKWEIYLKKQDDQEAIERANRQEQVWNRFVQTLDEYVLLFGEETFDPESFFSVLLSAFENNYYRMVPPTLDNVRIAEYKDASIVPRKFSIILGMTDQALPQTMTRKSLLDETTRDWLNQAMTAEGTMTQFGKELHFLDPNAQQQYNNEKFTFYQLLTSATERLILSYPYNSSSKNEKVSPFLELLLDNFEMEATLHVEQPVDCESEWILGNGNEQLQQLAIKQQQFDKLPENWQKVADQKVKNENETEEKTLNEKLLDRSELENKFTNLGQEGAKALYGEVPKFSISQLELFNKDPFSYFLRYGLKLKERQRFEVDQLQTGNYFHRVLELYFKKDWPEVDEAKMIDVLKKTVEEFEVFKRTEDHKDFNFRRQQLDDTLKLVVRYETLRLQALNISKIKTEQNFKTEVKTSSKGNQYQLRGKIDRVDQFNLAQDTQTNKDALGFQVIDYKSSDNSNNLKLSKLMDGSSLQLFTYFVQEWEKLDDDKKKILPIGFFYQEISNLISKDIQITNDDEYKKDINTEEVITDKSTNARFKGYILKDERSGQVPHIKSTVPLDTIYHIKLKKDGVFYTNDKKGLTEKQFSSLRQIVNDRIAQTVDSIMEGDIELSPLTFDNYTALLPSLTDYQAISRYDPTEDHIEKRSPCDESNEDILKDFLKKEQSKEKEEDDNE